MASSSVSQESIDIEDYDLCTRRSRIRMMRGRTTAGAHKTEYHESMESGDHRDPQEDEIGDADTNGIGGDHDSPTRLASRLKDKRMVRPNHLHKGKAAKDKRKLREKRRSTGVVHLQQPSTESTGDSLDEDNNETRRNTAYNEFIDEDNPQTPEEERKAFAARKVRNKSPSDLEADLEDNQDYDSTVSQSETNLTTIGHSSSPNGSSYQSDSPVRKAQATAASRMMKSSQNGGVVSEQTTGRRIAGSGIMGNTSRDTTPTSSKERSPPFSSVGSNINKPTFDRSQIRSASTLHHHQHHQQQNLPHQYHTSSSPIRSSQKSTGPTLTQPKSFPPPQSLRSQYDSQSDKLHGQRSSAQQRVHWNHASQSTSLPVGKQTAGSSVNTSGTSRNASSVSGTQHANDDIALKMEELELVLLKERQERQREKEERQRLQELLMERDKTIQDLKREITFLHQQTKQSMK